MGIQKISREEEARIPQFYSHEEAREWFKARYGDAFMMIDSEPIDGHKCYFYYLILDAEAFHKWQKEMQEQGYVAGLEFMKSYQSIQIMQDGSVHIVH